VVYFRLANLQASARSLQASSIADLSTIWLDDNFAYLKPNRELKEAQVGLNFIV
jgi:hypothetical protein